MEYIGTTADNPWYLDTSFTKHDAVRVTKVWLTNTLIHGILSSWAMINRIMIVPYASGFDDYRTAAEISEKARSSVVPMAVRAGTSIGGRATYLVSCSYCSSLRLQKEAIKDEQLLSGILIGSAGFSPSTFAANSYLKILS